MGLGWGPQWAERCFCFGWEEWDLETAAVVAQAVPVLAADLSAKETGNRLWRDGEGG